MSERVWVVTGTSSGLGLATALHALRQGDKVIATVRSLAKFSQILKDAGAHPLVLSLESPDDIIRSAAEESLKVYGHVDVLINNAGTMAGGYGPVEELSMEELRRHFQVNYFGQIAFTRPFITHFRTRGSGCIINVSTMISLGSYPSCSPYSGAKAALDATADALRAELRPYNVRVYTILPGVFPSNIQNSAAAYAKDLDNRGDAAMEALSKVYTDLSQGYDAVNVFPRSKGGDPEMFAQRVYEIVTETGLAKQVMGNHTDHPTWTRIPMGSDATRHIQDKGTEIAQNAKAYETLSRSTDSPAEPAETAKATSGPPPMGQRLKKLMRRYW